MTVSPTSAPVSNRYLASAITIGLYGILGLIQALVYSSFLLLLQGAAVLAIGYMIYARSPMWAILGAAVVAVVLAYNSPSVATWPFTVLSVCLIAFWGWIIYSERHAKKVM